MIAQWIIGTWPVDDAFRTVYYDADGTAALSVYWAVPSCAQWIKQFDNHSVDGMNIQGMACIMFDLCPSLGLIVFRFIRFIYISIQVLAEG